MTTTENNTKETIKEATEEPTLQQTQLSTTFKKQCEYQALHLTLNTVKEYLTSEVDIKKFSTYTSSDLTPELKQQLVSKIDLALETLSTLNPDTFDIKDMFEKQHSEILYNCLEFYGEYIHSILTYIGSLFREAFKEKFGAYPEVILENMKNVQQ